MNVVPTSLALRDKSVLVVRWSDGQTREYHVKDLRDACPCATCREKRAQPPPPANPLAVLSPQEAKPLTIEGMTPVGSYAYSIAFSDGHSTGIYTLEHLRQLGREV
jgi:DUF971 family protein